MASEPTVTPAIEAAERKDINIDVNTESSDPERQIGTSHDVAEAAAKFGIQSTHVNKKGADGALDYAATEAIVIDDATDRRLLWKTDLHVLPWLCGLYVLQYLDKGVLSYAGVMGIQTETNMTASEYNWLGSIYYVGYMAAVPIHNRLFQVVTPSKYIAMTVTVWGVVLCCMVACHNWAGLMVQRTALGALEGSINCGFTLVTAAWYKKHEHASRVGLWSGCTGVATMVGGLIAFGCLDGQQKHPGQFSSWKILALCTGLISIVYGICMYIFMAGSIVKARFFSEEEKTLAVERLRDNHQGVGSMKYKAYQAKEAWTDIRTWMVVVFVLASQIPTAGLVLLQSILIKNIGFSSKTTLLLNIPQGFVSLVGNVGFGYLAHKTKQRSGAALAASMTAFIAACVFIGLGFHAPYYRKYVQLVAYFIMSGLASTGWFIVISMMSSNILGTTKKTSVNAIVFVILGVAYFVGPQTFRDPPYYHNAKVSTLILWIVAMLVLVGFICLNTWDNKRRDKLEAERKESAEAAHAGNIEFMDLTDKENKLFRYVI